MNDLFCKEHFNTVYIIVLLYIGQGKNNRPNNYTSLHNKNIDKKYLKNTN